MKSIIFVLFVFFSFSIYAEEDNNFRKPLNIQTNEEDDKDYFKESNQDDYREFKLEVEVDEENSFDSYDRSPSNEEPELKAWPYSPEDDQMTEE